MDEAVLGAKPRHAGWAAIDDPDERLRTALRELYRWFDGARGMLERTTRDASLVPALRAPVERFGAWLDAAADAVVRGRPERGGRRRRIRGAVGHALSFQTWRSLVHDQGLSESQAIDLMAGLVAAAARG